MKPLLPLGFSLALLAGCSTPPPGPRAVDRDLGAQSKEQQDEARAVDSEWTEPAGDPELVEFLRWVACWRELSGPSAVPRCVERYPELAMRAAERISLDVEWLREIRAALASGLGARWKLAQRLVSELAQPDAAEPLAALDAALATGDPELVERVLEASAAVRIEPRKREEARAAAARAWSLRGQPERALALVGNATSVDERVEAAVAFAALGRTAEALEVARSAAAKRVGRAQAVLGALLAGLGRTDEARTELERAAAAAEGAVGARALSDLGLLELELGENDRARVDLARARQRLEELGDAAGLARSLLGEAAVLESVGAAEAARELQLRARELVRAQGLLLLVKPRSAPTEPVQPPQPRNSDARW